MDINIKDSIFLIKNSCCGCIHRDLCKYRQEKESFENSIEQERPRATSPIRFSLDCEQYSSKTTTNMR